MFGFGRKKKPEPPQVIHLATLIGIHRDGRMNVFTFARKGEVFKIETMGLLSDNVPQWRKQAGLED